MPLKGADSATPPVSIAQTAGMVVWGVYVGGEASHVWTREEVTGLGLHGIRAVFPFVVAPSPAHDEPAWWADETGGYATLEALVREAVEWGVPSGAPLCLDVEEGIAEAMGVSRSNVCEAWIRACAVHDYKPWTYGGAYWHEDTEGKPAMRMLAEWPEVAPIDPVLPGGFHAWQYAANVDGRDLDIFESGREYMGPDLQVGTFGSPEPEPAPTPPPVEPAPVVVAATPPADTEPAPVAEQEATASAISAQADEAVKVADAPVTPTHAAELRDLASKIRTHLAELDDLANRLESPKS